MLAFSRFQLFYFISENDVNLKETTYGTYLGLGR
jgi:hypothetical protein